MISTYVDFSCIVGLIIGGISSEDVSKIVFTHVLESIFKKNKAIIMGKSWGGFQATQIAVKYPMKVTKLCLVAPAFTQKSTVNSIVSMNIPVSLNWAKDDYVVWYWNAETWKYLGSNLHLYSASSGGHKILAEYAEPILQFLKQNN